MPVTPRFWNLLLLAAVLLSACNLNRVPSTGEPVGPDSPEPTPITPRANRLGIRSVDGAAEFYDTVTGEKFVPRGVNYVDFYPAENGGYEDRVMATNVYDPLRVRTAFRHLHAAGYNTVRIFFDNCSSGPACFGNHSGSGLNRYYLDNMVDLMWIAAEEGIYIIFTANTAPGEGGYWSEFDRQIYERNRLPGFESFQNADWLHPAGVAMKKKAWTDLMSGLSERDAPFEAVLGWQLTNEFWLWRDVPPLSWTSGLVTISNGETYDMADPEQKRRMVADGTLYFIETIVAVIKSYDPQALTTMGFFAPDFPNQTGLTGDRYVDTALLLAEAPLDFWDFHAYADADLTVRQQAENFGMVGYDEKPVLMGETGMGHAFVPSAQTAATLTAQWIADSCQQGFDGWLYWGYYPWPADMDGKPWAPLESDEFLFQALAPNSWPDPCLPPDLQVRNVSNGRPVRASRQAADRPAANAVDGLALEWAAGDYPPQWLEVELDEPTSVGQVGFTTAQWPPGYTHHQVWGWLADGSSVLLADFNGFTTVDMSLNLRLPVPLEGVTRVRFLTLEGPSWGAYRDVEVIRVPANGQAACIGKAGSALTLTNYPAGDARRVGGLAAGSQAAVSGLYTDSGGGTWAQVGGNAWARRDGLTLDGDCDLPELVVEDPGPPLVPVTFTVRVPEGTTGEVFMGGYFDGTPLPPWIPWMILLTNRGGGQWTVTIDLPVGTEVSYAYTRSNWETVERTVTCSRNVPSRAFIVEDSAAVQRDDTVQKWRDLGGCD